MSENSSSSATTAGIGFGCALAMVISFGLNKSIWWAILHGFFNWFYVLYYAFFLDRPV